MKRAKNEISLVIDEKTIPIIKQISEGMPGGFFIYHADGDEELIYANAAMLRIFGCDTEEQFRELTGYTFRGIVHPDDIDDVEESIAAQIENSKFDLDYVEYRIVRKDGTIRWVEDYGHFLYTQEYGNIFYVFIEDATDRLRTRITELEDINNKLQSIYAREHQYKKAITNEAVSFFEVNLSQDSFLTTDQLMIDGELHSICEFMERKSIKTYSEYIAHRADELNMENAESFRNFFSRERLLWCYDKGELEQSLECRLTDPSGRKHLRRYMSLLGKNKHTGDVIALSIAKDITEQIKRQRLLESALQQANVAKIARNTFLSNMSHDIRTPLNAILGYTELMKDNRHDPDKIADYTDKICLSSKQLLTIFKDSLEVTRMESGKVNLIERECHLMDLLADVEKTIISEMNKKKLKFHVDKSKIFHFTMIADYIRIKEILCQLLDNAMKYSDTKGCIKLILEESGSALNGYAKYRFIVEDNGIGISKEFQKFMFEPFKREYNTTQSGIPGTGLGLTLVKSFVDMMDGTITVDSQPKEGCRITVTLLLKVLEEEEGFKPTNTDEPAHPLTGARVLLAEDNEINCEIAAEILKADGFLVEIANNGKEAFDMLAGSEPGYYSVILMDIQMPVMDGYEATKAIRQLDNKRLANIPIIAFSANAFAEDYQKSLDAGMDAHFPKPIDRKNLRELLYRILSIRKREE